MTRNQSTGSFLGGLALGTITGAGLALLLAPVPGSETRGKLGEQSLVLRQRAEDVASRIARRDGATEAAIQPEPTDPAKASPGT